MSSEQVLPNVAAHVLVPSPGTLVCQRLLESLRSLARRVEQPRGGAEALLHLGKGGWQALYLDRHLPDLDAEELSLTIRHRFPATEVLLLDPEGESENAPAGNAHNSISEACPVVPESVPNLDAGDAESAAKKGPQRKRCAS